MIAVVHSTLFSIFRSTFDLITLRSVTNTYQQYNNMYLTNHTGSNFVVVYNLTVLRVFTLFALYFLLDKYDHLCSIYSCKFKHFESNTGAQS